MGPYDLFATLLLLSQVLHTCDMLSNVLLQLQAPLLSCWIM
jgi:hypothetical protein